MTLNTSPKRMTNKISLWKRCRYPFLFFHLHTSLGFILKFAIEKTIVAYKGIVCTILSTALCAVCVLPGRGKQFKSLGVIGGTQGNLGNESGCLAVRC